jgi:single-strand DNA-binding protein
MNETYVTVVGNAVDAPTRRALENGTSVCNFRVASTARRFDKEAGHWADGDSLYLKVTCWRQLADNVDASVRKGDPVVVVGRIFTRPYDRGGEKRSSYEMEAVSVGHDLARGISDFQRSSRVAPTYEVVAEAGTTAAPLGGDHDEDDDLIDSDYEVEAVSSRVA